MTDRKVTALEKLSK